MSNVRWIVRECRPDMPERPEDDPQALNLSAPDFEMAAREYFRARVIRNEIKMADVAQEFVLDISRLIDCQQPGPPGSPIPEAPILFTRQLSGSRRY